MSAISGVKWCHYQNSAKLGGKFLEQVAKAEAEYRDQTDTARRRKMAPCKCRDVPLSDLCVVERIIVFSGEVLEIGAAILLEVVVCHRSIRGHPSSPAGRNA
jgi:hypothetical protein